MGSGAATGRRSWSARAAARGRSDIATLLLAAATTAIMLQATRVFVSYMVFIIDQAQRVQLGATAGAVFLAIGFGAVLPRLGGMRRVVVATTAGMVAARIALQFWSVPEARMALGAATILLAGWLLPSLLTVSRQATAYGVGVGLALDLAFRVARDSLDLPFIPSVGTHGVTVALGLVALLAAMVLLAGDRHARPAGSSIGALAIGPALALQHLVIGNLGAVQVQLDVGMRASARLLAIGMLLGLVFDLLVTAGDSPARYRRGSVRGVLPPIAALGAMGLLVFWQDIAGLGAVGVVVGTAATIALTVAAVRGVPGEAGAARTALWLTVGMLVQAALLFAYFSATGWPILIAVAYGVIAVVGSLTVWRGPAPHASRPASLAGLGTVAAVLIMAVLAGTVGDDDPGATEPLPSEFTAMTYNIQAGFSRDNYWDLEEIAAVIETADPHVVVLQEVGRGWPILGGMDQARWLSQRLDMQLVWGPASRDDLWGNAILTRAPVISADQVKFDVTENLRRGAVGAVLESDAGPVTVIGTHLDNPGDATSARQAQITQLLDFWEGAEPALIAGDFNADPGSDAMVTLEDSGFTDTGELLGVDATTSQDNRRIDYVLITPGLAVVEADIPDVWASDHRPFVVRVQLTA
jgi:endonuclease/exonuclease/phosphatase family metal-dependent hydrolase